MMPLRSTAPEETISRLQSGRGAWTVSAPIFNGRRGEPRSSARSFSARTSSSSLLGAWAKSGSERNSAATTRGTHLSIGFHSLASSWLALRNKYHEAAQTLRNTQHLAERNPQLHHSKLL